MQSGTDAPNNETAGALTEGLSLLLLSLLLSCGPTTPQAKPHSTPTPAPTPIASAVSTPAPPIDAACVLRQHMLEAATPASWGDVRPGVWLLPNASGHEVFFPASYNGPYLQAVLAADGTLRDETSLAPFDGLGEASYPAIARLDDGVLAAVAGVYVAPKNADIYVSLRRDEHWSSPTAILPGSDLDTNPVVAAGHGRFAVAWNRGTYPSAPELAFALVEPDAKGKASVVSSTVLDPDAISEGKALVAVPGGWILFYTPSSALRRQLRGLFAIVLDRDGHELSRKQLLHGPALWPVASLQGNRIGVAFRASGGKKRVRGSAVGFLSVDTQGNDQGEWVVADQHEDPLAGFRPYSLLPADDGGWWLADIAGFSASVIIARPSEGRVVKLDADGRAEKHVVLNAEEVGTSSVRIVRHGETVRGVFVEDRGKQRLRAFELSCEAPASEPAKDPCAPRIESPASGRYKPLRALWEHSIEVDGDLVVAYRKRVLERATIQNDDKIRVARVRPNGESVWDVSLGHGYYPNLAYRAGTIAVLLKVDSGTPQDLVLLDAARGTVRKRRRLSPDVGQHCILGTNKGWLVAEGSSYGPRGPAPEIRFLDPDGTTVRRQTFRSFNACDLRAEGQGYLIAFTHHGNISETNHLFLASLDTNGRMLGDAHRVQDVHFARNPRLRRDLLLFSGPLSRVLSAVRILPDTSTTPAATVARTYGMLGQGFWGESIVWATGQPGTGNGEWGIGRVPIRCLNR